MRKKKKIRPIQWVSQTGLMKTYDIRPNLVLKWGISYFDREREIELGLG